MTKGSADYDQIAALCQLLDVGVDNASIGQVAQDQLPACIPGLLVQILVRLLSNTSGSSGRDGSEKRNSNESGNCST